MRKEIIGRRQPIDPTAVGLERMRLYCAAHPSTPSAVRQPHLFLREQLWIALLGPNAEQGIVGIGSSVESALRDFDTQYLAYLRPSAKASANFHAVRLARQADRSGENGNRFLRTS